MNDIAEGTILFIGAMVIILAGLVLYLILLLARVETILWRVSRRLRPEVERDGEGRPLYERKDR
jgi:hypothetical protein